MISSSTQTGAPVLPGDGLKREKSVFLLPVTPEPISRGRDRASFRWPEILEGSGLCTLKTVLHFISSQPFFYKEKSVGKGFGIRGRRWREGIWNSGKKLIRWKLLSGSFPASFHPLTSDSSLVPWASVCWAILCLSPVSWAAGMSLPGAQWLRYHLDRLQSPWVGLLMVSWSQSASFSSQNNSFYMH